MVTPASVKIAIVGGGIGGLTTCLAMRKAGFDATVYEKATSPDRARLGGGMTIFQNAIRVLDWLEVGDAVRNCGVRMVEMNFRYRGGAKVASWDIAKIEDELGVPAVALTRADLVSALWDAAADHIRPGHELRSVEVDPDSVTAAFAAGDPVSADLLIGADGITSRTREAIGIDAQPGYLGYDVWQAIIDERPPGADADGGFVAWYGPGARFGWYDVGHGRLHWYCTHNESVGSTDPVEGPIAYLRSIFDGWQEPIAALLAATKDDQVVRSEVRDLDPLERWGRGRVTLLGDAAHGMSFNIGQGACQAIEDAIYLTRRLEHHDDPVEGLRAYEDDRRKRTASLTKLARRIGGWGQWSNPAARLIHYPFLKTGVSIGGWIGHKANASTIAPL